VKKSPVRPNSDLGLRPACEAPLEISPFNEKHNLGVEQGQIGEEERKRNEGAGEETKEAARPLCVRQRELGG
jgi:hypothetical protein